MNKQHILLIEDDEVFRTGLKEFLETKGFSTRECATKQQAIETLEKHHGDIDVVISDLKLPDGEGIDVLVFSQKIDPLLPFIFITGQPDVESAVRALKAGAWDYLVKPVELEHLFHKIQSCIDTKLLKIENRNLKRKLQGFQVEEDAIIGISPNLQKVIEKARQIAITDITVLIEGESGTGKELLANFIHRHSRRKDKPFLKINCGALVKSLLEAELFGVTKGAYTGADKDRAGIFETASGGTIFLDEIGELDLESQVRLLRVIEEKKVYRIGSTAPVQVDVRIIAATNKNLLEEVEKGNFREDLYYRLAVAKLTLPPLRERKEDIPILFNHFVVEFNERYGKSITKLSQEVLKFFQNYDWPGNIRQFKNVLESMVILAKDDTLTMEDLPEELLKFPSPAAKKRLLDTIIPGISIEEYEKAIIQKNLEFVNGNREKAAELLGISPRTLYRKINEYQLRK